MIGALRLETATRKMGWMLMVIGGVSYCGGTKFGGHKIAVIVLMPAVITGAWFTGKSVRTSKDLPIAIVASAALGVCGAALIVEVMAVCTGGRKGGVARYAPYCILGGVAGGGLRHEACDELIILGLAQILGFRQRSGV